MTNIKNAPDDFFEVSSDILPRVLHVIRPANLTGAPVAMLNLVSQIHANGRFRVSVVCGGEGELVKRLRILQLERVAICPSLVRQPSPIQDLRTLVFLLRLLRQEHYQVVHTHSSKSGILARWAAKLAGVPVILHTVHGIPWLDNRLFTQIERFTARITDKIIALTLADAQRLLAVGIGNHESLTVIPNGMRTDDMLSICSDRSVLRSLGVPESALVIGMVARFRPQKRPDRFIEMAISLLNEGFAGHFVLIGDGELLPGARETAARSGFGDRIHFAGWRSDAWSLLQAFDVSVLSSDWEGLPITILESMILGVPVVGTRVRGIEDVIVHMETGLLAEPTPDGLADAVKILVNNPDLAKQLADQAQQVAIHRYDIRKIAEQTEELYQSLLPAQVQRLFATHGMDKPDVE